MAVLIDCGLIGLLVWRIPVNRFRALRWPLVFTAALVWSAFALLLVQFFWDSYYLAFSQPASRVKIISGRDV